MTFQRAIFNNFTNKIQRKIPQKELGVYYDASIKLPRKKIGDFDRSQLKIQNINYT